ncbi:hypothetical protein C8R47DRAFT_165343 [Mycena vitilis]|nr:hypothetical protein C8R47DRAFT_165343 [Mycena vitilis]
MVLRRLPPRRMPPTVLYRGDLTLPGFTTKEACDAIVRYAGNDDQQLIDCLVGLGPLKLELVARDFRSPKRQETLHKFLERKTSGSFETCLLGLVLGPIKYDADRLKVAIKGAGTDETVLNEILLDLTPEDVALLACVYKQRYAKSLLQAVQEDLALVPRRTDKSGVGGGAPEDEGRRVGHGLRVSSSLSLYDAWVVRDRLGRLVSSLRPYFLEDADMQAVMEDEPAPIFTCWNGIIVFRADPLLPIDLRKPGRLSTSPLSRPLPDTHPAHPQPASLTPAQTPPLRFRRSGAGSASRPSPSTSRTTSAGSSVCSASTSTRARSTATSGSTTCGTSTSRGTGWWWMRNVEAGNGTQFAKMVIGDAKRVWTWDECHPWW